MITDDVHGHVHNLYYESSAVVLTLVSLGKFMESRNMQKTKSAITALMRLTPDTALLADSGKEVPTSAVKAGDVLLVKPGARIPLDGVVTKGESSVNEAMLTGESLPVEKAEGSEVIGGSVNENGVLYVKVTRVGEDTTLSRIIRFVEDAQGKKAPISRTADKVAGIFVPTVIAIAAAGGGHLGHCREGLCLCPAGVHLCAGDRLPLCAGSGYAHRDHGGHRPGREARHPDPLR